MSTAFTFYREVRCKRYSLTDGEIYYYRFAETDDPKLADELAKELEKAGMQDIEIVFRSTIP